MGSRSWGWPLKVRNLITLQLRSVLVIPLDPETPAHGFIPPAFDTKVHAARCLTQLRSKDKDIEKYIFLSQLKHADESMFYRLCLENMQVCS